MASSRGTPALTEPQRSTLVRLAQQSFASVEQQHLEAFTAAERLTEVRDSSDGSNSELRRVGM